MNIFYECVKRKKHFLHLCIGLDGRAQWGRKAKNCSMYTIFYKIMWIKVKESRWRVKAGLHLQGQMLVLIVCTHAVAILCLNYEACIMIYNFRILLVEKYTFIFRMCAFISL